MNGMFRNSRGLGDLAKHSHIADGCRDYDLDFIAILETGRQNFSQSFLDCLSDEINF
jgi:hypothetical protein